MGNLITSLAIISSLLTNSNQVGSLSLSLERQKLNSYFSNLNSYRPYNFENKCCSFVSLIECLTFYDCYFNDNIVPESYERFNTNASSMTEAKNDSPGVLCCTYGSESDATYNLWEEYCLVDYYKSEDYLFYLIDLFNRFACNQAPNYSYSIEKDTLDDFLQTEFGWSFSYVYSDIESLPDAGIQEMFLDYIKMNIDDGHPVIVNFVTIDDQIVLNNHSAVAYKYDSSGVYIHNGSFSDQYDNTCVLLDSVKSIYTAGIIDFGNMAHSHSNNFVVNNEGLCGCGYHESHSYSFYEFFTNTKHKAFCNCGKYITQNHTINSNSIYYENGHQRGVCDYCSATIDLGTTPIIIHGNSLKTSNNVSYVFYEGNIVYEGDRFEI